MKRCLLLFVLMLLPLAALGEPLNVSVNGNNEATGFTDNSIIVRTEAAGSLFLSLGDEYGVYRTWEQPVSAGETRLYWDGLGWNQERITDGAHLLTARLTCADGTEVVTETAVTMKKCANALLFALPSDTTLYLEGTEDWFCEVRCVRRGDTVAMRVFSAEDIEDCLGVKKITINAGGPVKFGWDGKLDGRAVPPGEYYLLFTLEENPEYVHEVYLTVEAGSPPVIPLAVSPAIIPERGMTDAQIWAIMQLPSVVADVEQESHLTIRAEKGEGAELGTVHGQSQALQVLALEDGFARVGAWNHETGDYVEGWVKQSALKTVTPDGEYGVLIDKAAQTMTVYRQGTPLDTFPISTGLPAENRMIRETAAGAFLTVDRISNFESDGYQYDHAIRYDGGNLIHQMGYRPDGKKQDFSDHAAVLGMKASHGCTRVSNIPSASAGINAYWLYTHLPYHTRVIILDDPEQRAIHAAAAGEPTMDLTRAPVAPPALAEGERELVVTVGGDAVIATREKWWKQEEAFPAYIAQSGMEYPFRNLLPIFAADDMTLVNLECVLKADKRGEQTSKEYRFRGLPEWTGVLTAGSIEQVSIANNHYIDYGASGREATRQALTDAGIPFSGYEYLYIWEHEGVKVGFGGIRETMYKQDPSTLSKDVLALKQAGCDVIIYLCHWGTEYDPNRNAQQEQIAAAAAAAGVDVLIGGHPHVVQGIDSVGSMPVIYSLGNLMFGGTHDMTTFDGMLVQLRLRFRGEQYAGCTVELIPILTSGRASENVNDFCPVPAIGADASRILNSVQADTPFALLEQMYFPAQ